MKNKWVKYLLPFILFLVVLAVVLYFIYPPAPLFLLLALLIQAPLIWVIIRQSSGAGYMQRAQERKKACEKSGDAKTWLLEECRESQAVGFKYWPKQTRALNILTCAQGYIACEKPKEAAALLQQLNPQKLSRENRRIFDEIKGQVQDEI